jgi:hypothetical protein
MYAIAALLVRAKDAPALVVWAPSEDLIEVLKRTPLLLAKPHGVITVDEAEAALTEDGWRRQGDWFFGVNVNVWGPALMAWVEHIPAVRV